MAGMAVLILVTGALLTYGALAGSVWAIVGAVVFFLAGFLVLTVAARVREAARQGGYPHRPDVERRTEKGDLTTDGYAAGHPEEFPHWANGRYVAEERIDRDDWEAWNRAWSGR